MIEEITISINFQDFIQKKSYNNKIPMATAMKYDRTLYISKLRPKFAKDVDDFIVAVRRNNDITDEM